MTILDAFPHICTAKRRTRTKGSLGGSKDSFPTTVFTDRACSRQVASASQIQEFEKKGITVTDKVFFTSDPGIDERHILTDVRNTGAMAGTGDTLEVRSRPVPDASVGLGVVYRVMAEISTTGSTSD